MVESHSPNGPSKTHQVILGGGDPPTDAQVMFVLLSSVTTTGPDPPAFGLREGGEA